MSLRLITPPAAEPLTLAEAKAHLRVTHNDEDNLISALISAARSFVDGKDGFLGRALITQTWDLIVDEFPDNELKIPLPPLQSIVQVVYDDAGGTQTTLPVDQYSVDSVSEPGWIVPPHPGGWPSTFDGINAVRVRFIAGYLPGTGSPVDLAANVPASIKQAMLLHIGANYEQRENVIVGLATMMIPFGAENLLRPYRVVVPFA